MSNQERKFSRGEFLEMMGAGTAMVIVGCTPPPEVPAPEGSSIALLPEILPTTPSSKASTPPATLIPFTKQQATIPELTPTPVKQETKKTGLKILWQVKIERNFFKSSPPGFKIPIPASPFIIQNESLFLTRAQNQKFIKINLENGMQVWKDPWDFGGIPLAATKNVVWVLRNGEDRLYGLNTKEGEKQYRIDFDNPLDNIPINSNGKLFFITHQDIPGPGAYTLNTINVIDQETGKEVKKSAIRTGLRYSFRIKDVVKRYIILASSALHPDGLAGVFDLDTDLIIEQQQGIIEKVVIGVAGEDRIVTMIAPYRSGVLIPNNLEGYNIASGQPLWSFPKPTRWPPLWFSNEIILATTQKQDALIAIDPISGNSFWTNDEISPKQILETSNEQVVVATENLIAGYSKKDGTKRLWKYDLGDLKPNGVNCVGTSFGKEFVFFVGKNSQGGKRLVFRNPDGSQSKPDVSIEFDPKRIVASGNFLIIEGEKDIAVVG